MQEECDWSNEGNEGKQLQNIVSRGRNRVIPC